MKFKGTITEWNDARGFGFIAPAQGGPRVFCHVNAFVLRSPGPATGMRVTYTLGRDDRGRARAEDVRPSMPAASPARAGSPRDRQDSTKALVVSVLFVLSLVGWVLAGRLPWWMPLWYMVASLVAFIVYWIDKASAMRDRWRIRESTLQWLALLGGWPGAWVAQQGLRHKSRKVAFQVTFWAAVVANLAGLGWLIWAGGDLAQVGRLP
jgi:uncharacterized membrane protein YsdA (DUF1294 family)/cold shock CspA family protein